jgi:hypothetical protein
MSRPGPKATGRFAFEALKMPKDYRVVIRISAEDHAWLATESERIGCDMATWVRMMIKRAISGELETEPATVAPWLAPAPIRPFESQAHFENMPPSEPAQPDLEPQGYDEPLDHEQRSSAAPVDPADILARRLAEAEAQPEPETAYDTPPAIQMRRIPRERYNPGYR